MITNKTARLISAAAFGIVLLVVAGAANVDALVDYPDHPIRMLLEFPAGGNVDIVARRIALKLTERLGKRMVVDNRGGAGGVD